MRSTLDDSSPSARRRAWGVLAVAGWLALALQFVLIVDRTLDNGGTFGSGVVRYFGYFTILTNIFLAAVASAQARRESRRGTGFTAWLARPAVTGCAVAAIILVSLGYHLLLSNERSQQGLRKLTDVLLHYLIPAGGVVLWSFARPLGARTLRWWIPLVWTTYPAGYFAYVLARGEILGRYPYPFVDVTKIGYREALENGMELLAAHVVIGIAVLAIARWRWRTNL